MTLNLDSGLFNIIEFHHVNPGKGAAFVRTKLRNTRTGAVVDRTFRAGERIERSIIDTRKVQLLYVDGNEYVFMDDETFDQFNVSEGVLGDCVGFVLPNEPIEMRFFNDEIVGIKLPPSIAIRVAKTDPGLQGDRVSGATKPAELETGLVVAVPLFVAEGDRVIVDTRTSEYIGRSQQ